MKAFRSALTVGLALTVLTPEIVFAQAKASKGQQMQTQASGEVPHCSRKLGTLSIVDGDDPTGWTQ